MIIVMKSDILPESPEVQQVIKMAERYPDVHAEVRKAFVRGEDLVVACSALKQAYRALLAGGIPVTWVHLDAPADIIRARLEHRTGHFMKANMLSSQIEALERPADAIAVDASQEPAAIVEEILARLRLRTDC